MDEEVANPKTEQVEVNNDLGLERRSGDDASRRRRKSRMMRGRRESALYWVAANAPSSNGDV